MHTITKEFQFEYGHRVWSQTLDPALAIDTRCVCRHLHGHSGRIVLSFEAQTLKDGMIVDFKHTNWFKQWLDRAIDHKFILDIDDPGLYHIIPERFLPSRAKLHDGTRNCDYIQVTGDNESELCDELYGGIILVPFVPTSENLAAWIYRIVAKQMGGLRSVRWSETAKTSATFTALIML